MMDVRQVGDRTLRIDGSNHRYVQDIEAYMVLEDKVIVTFAGSDFPRDHPDRARNIMALDLNGQVIWRIEDFGFKSRDSKGDKVPVGYAGVFWSKDEPRRLRVSHWLGVEMDLDPETGKISNYEQTY